MDSFVSRGEYCDPRDKKIMIKVFEDGTHRFSTILNPGHDSHRSHSLRQRSRVNESNPTMFAGVPYELQGKPRAVVLSTQLHCGVRRRLRSSLPLVSVCFQIPTPQVVSGLPNEPRCFRQLAVLLIPFVGNLLVMQSTPGVIALVFFSLDFSPCHPSEAPAVIPRSLQGFVCDE